MGRSLFVITDPRVLETYSHEKPSRRRRSSPEKLRYLVRLRQGLQSLPPRELSMLYLVKAKRNIQELVSPLFSVRQSNVSYRLNRAQERIRLHHEFLEICSETQLRRQLIEAGLTEPIIRMVTGTVRTTSQSATAQALSTSQGTIRHHFDVVLKKLESIAPDSPALALLRKMRANPNGLRALNPQSRFQWKVQQGTDKPAGPDQRREGQLGKRRYKGVSSTRHGWETRIKSDGRYYRFRYFETIEEAALAYDLAFKIFYPERSGPNKITPEMVTEPRAAAVKSVVLTTIAEHPVAKEYTGITYQHGRYVTYINLNGRRAGLGTYQTLGEAAVAYNIGHQLIFGGGIGPNPVQKDELSSQRLAEITAFVQRQLRKRFPNYFTSDTPSPPH